MATQNYYFAASQPEGALPDGTNASPTNPLGTGITVATASTAAAQVELRVLTTTGSQNAGSGALTVAEIIKTLERFKAFLRQRGFIAGSGGPSGAWDIP